MERGALFLRGITGLSLVATLMACNAISGAGDLGVAQSESRSRTDKYDAGVEGDDDPSDTSNGAKTGGSSSSGGTDAGVATPDAAPANPTFTDDFGRANGAIGNGWVERSPGMFPIKDGASQQGGTGNVPAAVVIRPPAEDAADVEVSVTIKIPDVQGADPGVVARVQTSGFTAYNAYLGDPMTGVIDRIEGKGGTNLGTFNLSPPLAAGDVVRVVLKVTGDSPVKLEASVVDGNGTVRGSTMTTDASAARITNAGSVGFGGSMCVGARFDDFKRVTLLTP